MLYDLRKYSKNEYKEIKKIQSSANSVDEKMEACTLQLNLIEQRFQEILGQSISETDLFKNLEIIDQFNN